MRNESSRAQALRWKRNWMTIKNRVNWARMQMGAEAITYTYIYNVASDVLGFNVQEKPHVEKMCDRMYEEHIKQKI